MILTQLLPAAVLMAALTGAAAAAQFDVNTPLDTPDANPGDGLAADLLGRTSLRAAIQEANALGGSHTIKLQSGVTYLLTLAGSGEDAGQTGDLDVTADIDIAGKDAVVDGLGLDRVFDVQPGGGLKASNFTVRNGVVNGDSGGGFRSAGTLVLSRMNVTGCKALGAGGSGGGVFNDGGQLQVLGSDITDCEAERAGGGIEAEAGTTLVDRGRVEDNRAGPGPGNGGGLHLTGTGDVQVTASSFRFNQATREGGGLWNSSTGTMSIDDTRVNQNVALGAAADDGGGGLFNDGGTLTVTSSVLWGNLASVGSGSGGGAFNNGGTLDIRLTKVMKNSASRAGGGVEALGGTTILFNDELGYNSTGASPGNGGGLHLTGSGIVLIELTDVLENTAAAEGGGLWNSVTGAMTVTSSYVARNVASGSASDQGGGGLFNDGGTLTIDGSVVEDNVADGAAGSGGGVLNLGGQLTVRGTRFSGNDAQRAGGAVEANGGTTDLEDVVARANRCGPFPGNGGGLHLTGAGQVTVAGSVFDSNVATAEGGGLWNSKPGTMTLTDCEVVDNTASGDDADQGGGGVFNDEGQLTITGGVLSGNVADGASGSGGGLLNNLGTADLVGVTLAGNTSRRAGGGVEANAGTTSLTRVRLESNVTGDAPGNGGGLHLSGAGLVTLADCSVTRNSAASEGGGLWNSATGVMTVTDPRLCENGAPVGGDVFNDGGSFTINGKAVPPGP